jgi:hypothetical protein
MRFVLVKFCAADGGNSFVFPFTCVFRVYESMVQGFSPPASTPMSAEHPFVSVTQLDDDPDALRPASAPLDPAWRLHALLA